MKQIYQLPLLILLLIHLSGTYLGAQSTVYESEPNDLFTTADALTIGDTMRGAISTNGDEDIFAVTIPRAGVFDVSVTNIQSPVDMRLVLYDANYGQVGGPYGDPNSNGSPLFFRKLICPPGTYYFMLEDFYQNESASGLYKFVVQLDTTDVYECNNTFQDAAPISLGDTIRAAINSGGDQDYFKVVIPRAGVFDVSVTNVPSPVDIGVQLYDANQSPLSGLYGATNSNGSPLFFRKLVCLPGTYYFRLEDYQYNDESARGLYKLFVQLDTTDAYECNNTFQDAALITLGDTIRAAINSGGDQDYFKVTIPRAGVFDVSVTDVESPVDIGVQLYDANQNPLSGLYGAPNSNGDPLFFRKLVCLPGTYYFRLEDYQYNDESARGLYKFVVQLDTTDAYECNNTFQDAALITLGDTIRAAINSGGDQDYFKVTIPRAGVFDVSVTSVESPVDIGVQLYDANQNPLSGLYGAPNSNGSPLFFRKLVCLPGTYYFRLEDYQYNDESARGLYKLVVELDTTDAYECNNSFQNAMPVDICDTLIGTFSFNDDLDYYSFNAQANQVLSFTLTQVPSNVNPRVRVYDAFQTQLYDRNLNFGQPLLDSITTPVTGQYFMLVNDRDNNANSTLPYRLLLKQGCITTSTDLASAGSITLYPNPAEEKALLRVATTLETDYLVRIYDAWGKLLLLQKCHEGVCELDTQALPVGIYLVEIQAEGLSVTKRLVIQR